MCLESASVSFNFRFEASFTEFHHSLDKMAPLHRLTDSTHIMCLKIWDFGLIWFLNCLLGYAVEPSEKSVEIMRKFSEQYARRSGTYFCMDKGVTSVVIKVRLL